MSDQLEREYELSDAWKGYFSSAMDSERRVRRIFGLIPSDPRCKFCNAPFHGIGAPLMRAMGKRRSTMSPNLCDICEQFASKNPGGAIIQMSMLFADIRGSTTLAEGMNPSEFSQIINRFYKAATDVLARNDGLIDKLSGDEVAAFFFPPIAETDFPRRAVKAAEELLRATGHARRGGPWVPVGAGVHTGEAFFGAVGSSGGMTDVTALGDAVNTAARLASVAGPGEIVISEDTVAAAGLDTGGMERRTLELKGRSEPVDVCVMRVSPA